MAGVTLSEIPETGTDLEHFVAALFQAAGYYVEKNLIERLPADVLELDIVVSDYGDATPTATLIETKGGGWGWSDLFKVLGWMSYLNLPRAALFVKTSSDNPIEQMVSRLGPFGMSVVYFEDFANPLATFAAAGYAAPADDALLALWRHSYSVELKLTKFVINASKSQPNQLGPKAALEYQRLVNDGTFFAKSAVERLAMLYEAYKQHPKLTLACAVEMAGGPFDPHTTAAPNAFLEEALREGKHPLLQASMFIEHRARLALLRAAIDYACEFPTGPPPIAPGETDGNNSLVFHSLPASFYQGLAWLRQQPTFRRYGVLWQQFLWGWGGFYLEHRQAEEFQWMATYSGVPPEEVPVALEAFDRLFPLSAGWLTTAGRTDARIVRMVPTYFQGIGAHHRRQQYNLQDSFDSIDGSQYTVSDLVRWNNAAVAFLTA